MTTEYSTNWMEAFLFLYWDIQRYRPENTEKTDELILDFFYDVEPTAESDPDPYAWRNALYRLMRIMNCRLGAKIYPGTNYQWLVKGRYRPTSLPEPPFIDWFWLQPHTSIEARQDATLHVSAIIDHATSVTSQQMRAPNTMIDPREAWFSNPFLKEFSDAHKLPEWSVPLTVDVECLLPVGWQNVTGLAMCKFSTLYNGHQECHRHAKRHMVNVASPVKQVFSLLLEDSKQSTHPVAKIKFPSESLELCIEHGKHRQYRPPACDLPVIDAAKQQFIAMLYWARTMAASGHALPFPKFLDQQLGEWDVAEDEQRLKLNKMVWNAIRSFGLEPVKSDRNPTDETAKSPQARRFVNPLAFRI